MEEDYIDTDCLSDKEWFEQNEKFEEWAKKNDHDLFVDDYGEYDDWTTRQLWEAWQSSYLANRHYSQGSSADPSLNKELAQEYSKSDE